MSRIPTIIAVWLMPVMLVASGCVRAPSKQPEIIVQAEQYQRRGVSAFRQADYVTARSMFENALRQFESIDDANGMLQSNINLVECTIRTRKYKEAMHFLQKAQDIASRNRLTDYQARTTLLESSLALLTGQREQAITLMQPLLPAFQGEAVTNQPGDIMLAATANRTRIAFANKDDDAALWTIRFANALKASKKSNLALQGRLLRFQASLAQRDDNFDQAHQLLEAALAKYKGVLSQPGISATLLESGKLHLKQQNWNLAREDLQRATTIRIRMQDREGTVEGLGEMAELEGLAGNPQTSKSLKNWIKKLHKNSVVNWSEVHQAIQY